MSLASGVCFGSIVVTAPATAGEALSADYDVSVAGQPVAVYTARVLDPPFDKTGRDYGGPYAFANFDMSGTVAVRIVSKRSLGNAIVRPSKAVTRVSHEGDHILVLTLKGPCQFSVEPDGKKGPLLLFANPLEKKPPQAGNPGVVYFGPGIHQPGRITLTNNQTLYLADGAVVKGGVVAEGRNICITGRGILDGSDWEWQKGPTPYAIGICGTNVEVSGITIRGAFGWTIVPRNSRQVTVRNVKLCGSRVQNDDGIDVCNSQDVLVSDCFLRTDDDCVALKGLEFSAANSNVERITVQNCVLWCDRARIFLLGHESRAAFMRQVTLRNLEVIHFCMTAFLFEPGEDMRLEDIQVADVRIYGEGQSELIRLKPSVNEYMERKTPGFVRGVSFRNLTLSGAPGKYLVQLESASAEHATRDVTFENVEILGESLAKESSRLQIGSDVTGVHIIRGKP
ncbi:MAG: glycosyl hydrolase family 28 protein [Verrucomicrobiota bacterium]